MVFFGKAKINTKLVVATLVGLFLLGGGITLLSVTHSRESLISARRRQLISIREGIREHIRNYMDLTGKLLVSMARDRTLKDALSAYQIAFHRIAQEAALDPEIVEKSLLEYLQTRYLNKVNYQVPHGAKRKDAADYLPETMIGRVAQYLFISENPYPAGERDRLYAPKEGKTAYGRIHNRYHGTFNAFLTNFRLYDVFLVDEEGFVLYTDYKEQDFGTNLLIGPYKDTGLAKAFRRGREIAESEITFLDFQPYEPSYNLPAAFIGTPMVVAGERAGVFIIQIPIDPINEIVTFNGNHEISGLGRTGECFLVGDDRRMRSDSRFLQALSSPLVRALNTTVGIQSIATPNVLSALAGRQGTRFLTNYRGREVISAYAPVNVFDKTGAMAAEIETAEALADIRRLTAVVLTTSSLIILAVALAYVIIVRRIVVTPLNDFIGKTRKLAEQSGDLSQKIEVKSKDELGTLAEHFNTFIDSLKGQMVEIQKTAEVLNDAVFDLSALAGEIDATAGAQATATHQIVATMEESGRVSREITERVEGVAAMAAGTTENVDSGVSLTRGNSDKMDEIKTANEDVTGGIRELGERIGGIWEIVKVINAITEQTKMISFNAQLEATAAGDMGKNFKIVANEIRRLADNTTTSTRKIESQIHEIQSASDDLIAVSSDSTEKITAGWKLSGELETIFTDISKSSEMTSDSAERIADSVRQQAGAFEEILSGMKQISSGVDSFVESTKTVGKTAGKLKRAVEALGDIVGAYRV